MKGVCYVITPLWNAKVTMARIEFLASSKMYQLIHAITVIVGLLVFKQGEAAGNLQCYTNPLSPPGPVNYPSLTPVSPAGTYTYGNSYIWGSVSSAVPNS
ncbi:hypothetical protein CEUSTIGMA_g8861.t1 [Chlamydomonas eustigma]|uniref:Uncharacterized protein n=1 Tax=Chlamydomonas eustigma TaxID=1157962 RepID=A0A250XEF4_9CHLO|nr:hypothetical protein CEUSTIGMA_g8861.t1 [Chlamydomonas eustigma]|eukprot:GAX81431.1 hypothetical protein CEUSTIGMA_g8861.t1 [Chlamydomonas eustigma]